MNEHIDHLETARHHLVEQRRQCATRVGLDSTNLQHLVDLQMRIETIDRALDDEKRIAAGQR